MIHRPDPGAGRSSRHDDRVRPRPSLAWRAAVAGAVSLGTLTVMASPAAADPPGPTDYRSTIERIIVDRGEAGAETAGSQPVELDGLEASIVGGDGFLMLEVDRGTTVEVQGYTGEPYLRFGADGVVEENRASAASYLNESRTRTDTDREYDPDAEPRWEQVATDGRWAWHDHRIHHMGGGTAAARTAEGQAWEVPVTVDGQDLLILGNYRLLDAPSPLPWIGLAVVLAVAVAGGLGRLVSPLTGGGASVLLAGIGGVVAGMAQRAESPPGAPTSPLVVVLPAIAVIAGIIVVMQRGRVLRAVAGLAGAAALGGWAIARLEVLWKAILPTSLPAATDRLLTAVALGAAAGAAILVVRSGALAPDLQPDDEDKSPTPAAESA